MANTRLTISIPSNEIEIIKYVNEKRRNGCFSAYIRELIRKDKEKGQAYDFEQIYKYVEKRLRENGLVLTEAGHWEETKIIDEVDKEVILNLF